MKLSYAFKIAGLALGLLLVFSGCGQLSPDKMAEFDRERAAREAENSPPSTAVNNLQWNSIGTTDLRYLITYISSTQGFNIIVSRAHGVVVQNTVSLTSADHQPLHAALLDLFNGKLRITPLLTCATCPTLSEATLIRNDNSATRYSFPQLMVPRTGDVPFNFFDTLNQFILNRL